MSQVFNFNGESFCVVFCTSGSRDVRMWSARNVTEKQADTYAKRIRDDGGYVFRVCKTGVLVAALELIKENKGI